MRYRMLSRSNQKCVVGSLPDGLAARIKMLSIVLGSPLTLSLLAAHHAPNSLQHPSSNGHPGRLSRPPPRISTSGAWFPPVALLIGAPCTGGNFPLPRSASRADPAHPKLIEGGGVQGQVRDLGGFPAGQHLVPQLADHQAGPVQSPLGRLLESAPARGAGFPIGGSWCRS